MHAQFLLCFLLIGSHTMAGDIFFWKWEAQGKKIKITGSLKDHRDVVVSTDRTLAEKRFLQIYNIINDDNTAMEAVYDSLENILSKELALPFKTLFDSSESVIVQIDSVLIGLPIEFLTIDTRPVLVIHQTEFMINGYTEVAKPEQFNMKTGFILRDTSADPFNVCQNIVGLYPNSTIVQEKQVTAKDLEPSAGVDFVLISAHGGIVRQGMDGAVGVGFAQLHPDFFTYSNPKLVYIDGCQQGMNLRYVLALAGTKEVNYYVAPTVIVGYDYPVLTGFFGQLKVGRMPVYSLWHVVKGAWRNDKENMTKISAIRHALVFRIYRV